MENVKYLGRFIKVTEEKIGDNLWERVYLPDGVEIFPMNDIGEIALIEERRPHEKKPIRLKFVTGLLDKNEDPILCANREMQEEIGFKADHLEIILHKESTGTVNNNFYQILAMGLSESKLPNPDGEDTIVRVIFFSIAEIEALLEQGKLPWSMGALGIYKIKSLIENEKLSFNFLSKKIDPN